MEISLEHWRRCSSCKKPIRYRTKYWVCSVSTCNRKRTGLVFCSVPCWDAHVPVMNHRDAWAEERFSPSLEAWKQEQEREEQAAARRPEPEATRSGTTARSGSSASQSAPSSSPSAPSAPARSILRPAGGPSRETSTPGGPVREVGAGASSSVRETGAAGASSAARESISSRSVAPAASMHEEREMDDRDDSDDILVVASKLKAYIRARSGMNTSASVLEVLSDRLRALCDDAIEEARREGRKTVLDRDFK